MGEPNSIVSGFYTKIFKNMADATNKHVRRLKSKILSRNIKKKAANKRKKMLSVLHFILTRRRKLTNVCFLTLLLLFLEPIRSTSNILVCAVALEKITLTGSNVNGAYHEIRLREASHIDFTHKKRPMHVMG